MRVVGRDDVIKTPRRQRVADFKQRQLPGVVWFLSIAICGLMLLNRTRPSEYIGLAQAVQYEISAPTVGRVDAVLVDVYQPVGIGDLVVKLDDSELEARIERARASIRVLRAELIAARGQLQSSNESGLAGWTNDLRRFQTDEEDRRLVALDLRVTIESDEIDLERLKLRDVRIEPLAREGIVDPLLHSEIRLEIEEVKRRIENTRGLLAQTEAEFRAARTRRHEYEANLPQMPAAEPFLGPLRASIEVESQRLREIETRRAALVMRSPIEGQVTQILCRRGQSVVAGEPIVTITDRTVREIVTYLTEADDRPIVERTPVVITSLERPDQVVESFVTRVSGSVELLPVRLWANPSIPRYGRAVVIAALPTMALRPGELLSIKFLAN
jgi:multidrug resistance efflux pump